MRVGGREAWWVVRDHRMGILDFQMGLLGGGLVVGMGVSVAMGGWVEWSGMVGGRVERVGV